MDGNLERIRTKNEQGSHATRQKGEKNAEKSHLHNSERNGHREFKGERLERLLNSLFNASFFGIADR